MKKVRRLPDRFRVRPGRGFRLKDWDPGDTAGLRLDKKEAGNELAKGIRRLRQLQVRLYAQDRWSLLVVLQAMDAAGKDGTISHVLSGLNPQGVEVHSFKAPTAEELDHDFLWRVALRLPERGRIGIFNRSHYEEVVVVRAHAEILRGQHLPQAVVGPNLWKERYQSINDFERHLSRNGTRVLKFYLNVSKEEQAKRLLARLSDPEKNWKFSPQDIAERALWDDSLRAYEAAIAATSTRWAPWYVVPADHKWFTRLVVAQVIVAELEKLDLQYPAIAGARKRELDRIRRELAKGAS